MQRQSLGKKRIIIQRTKLLFLLPTIKPLGTANKREGQIYATSLELLCDFVALLVWIFHRSKRKVREKGYKKES